MRTKNSIRNATFGFASYFFKAMIQFIVRTVFIYTLGAELLGLNGLFLNVLSMLSLAELGIGAAITYSLYKPVADKDTEKIKALLAFYKKTYFFIGLIVLGIGLILTPFLPYLIKDSAKIQYNLYVLFLITLSNTVIGYFFAHKRTIIFANQRNDIEQKIALVFQFLMGSAQIVVLLFIKNYFAYVIIMPAFTFVDLMVVAFIANKRYPYITEKPSMPLDDAEKKQIYKNTSALILHKIGAVVVFSTDNLIISAVLGLTILGYYSNYVLITAMISAVLGLLTTAICSSVGNMIAKDSKAHTLEIFRSLNFGQLYLAGFCAIALFVLFQPFIELWIGVEYQLDLLTTGLIITSFYLSVSRKIILTFKEAAGLFWQDRFKPIVESIVNLSASLILVYYFGLPGLILGTIISTLAMPLWVEPFVLYKHYFKKSVIPYFLKYAVCFLITVITGAITYFTCSFLPDVGILPFLGKMAICIIVPNLIFLLCYFKTPEFKYLIKTGIMLLKTLKKRKNVPLS